LERAMPIYRLLQNSAFDPDHIELMSVAFEDACRDLGFTVREGALRDIIAKAIIECGQKEFAIPLN
jgi:hypothetical protein